MSIRVVIADDHKIVRSGIEMMINRQSDMEVIGTAADGEEAYQQAVRLKPDIVIMDLNMPPGENGLLATKRLKETRPEIKILILTMHDDKEYIFRVLQAGASGYILKSADDMDLIQAYESFAFFMPMSLSKKMGIFSLPTPIIKKFDCSPFIDYRKK